MVPRSRRLPRPSPGPSPAAERQPVLTLNSNVTGSLWEGETLGCNPYSTACSGVGGSTPQITLGTQITGILSGTWGASGSTYSLTAPSGATDVVNVVLAADDQRGLFDNGGGPAVYAGPDNDIVDQNGPAAVNRRLYRPSVVWRTGGRRIGHRAAVHDGGGAQQQSDFCFAADAQPRNDRRAATRRRSRAHASTSAILMRRRRRRLRSVATVLTFNGLAANARPYRRRHGRCHARAATPASLSSRSPIRRRNRRSPARARSARQQRLHVTLNADAGSQRSERLHLRLLGDGGDRIELHRPQLLDQHRAGLTGRRRRCDLRRQQSARLARRLSNHRVDLRHDNHRHRLADGDHRRRDQLLRGRRHPEHLCHGLRVGERRRGNLCDLAEPDRRLGVR